MHLQARNRTITSQFTGVIQMINSLCTQNCKEEKNKYLSPTTLGNNIYYMIVRGLPFITVGSNIDMKTTFGIENGNPCHPNFGTVWKVKNSVMERSIQVQN